MLPLITLWFVLKDQCNWFVGTESDENLKTVVLSSSSPPSAAGLISKIMKSSLTTVGGSRLHSTSARFEIVWSNTAIMGKENEMLNTQTVLSELKVSGYRDFMWRNSFSEKTWLWIIQDGSYETSPGENGKICIVFFLWRSTVEHISVYSAVLIINTRFHCRKMTNRI